MIIGVPTEVMEDEYRVSLTPDKADVLVRAGHEVRVQRGAGEGASFPDEDYEAVGASLVDTPAEVFASDIVAKVKEPQPEEHQHFRDGLALFCYLHLAANPDLTQQLVDSRVTGIALETMKEADGSLPILYPMSEIAGIIAPQIAARLLQRTEGGPGKLLSGVPGTEPCSLVIVGAGTVGRNSAVVASGLGADVTVFDIDVRSLRSLDAMTGGAVTTLVSTPQTMIKHLSRADVVIGAVHIPGAKAPSAVSTEMVESLRPGTIVIDVAIDQGGSVAGIRATTHSDPTYVKDGVTYYAVRNMPAVAANTASVSLSKPESTEGHRWTA